MGLSSGDLASQVDARRAPRMADAMALFAGMVRLEMGRGRAAEWSGA